MKKEDLQPIRSSKTGHETVVSKKAFEDNKGLYAPYIAITWNELKTFELVEEKKATVAKKPEEKGKSLESRIEKSKKKSDENESQ